MEHVNIVLILISFGLLIGILGFLFSFKGQVFTGIRMAKLGAVMGVGAAVATAYSGYFLAILAAGMAAAELVLIVSVLFLKPQSRNKVLILHPLFFILTGGITYYLLVKLAPLGY